MSIALDLGTHAARSLRIEQSEMIRRQSRSVALLLEDGASARSWLKESGIPFIPCDDRLAVTGQPAAELAEVFSLACHDLLPDAQVPFADPVTRQLIAALVDSLLPVASRAIPICCFTQPGYGRGDENGDAHLDRRLEFISRVIRLRGYDPMPINPALALVLAELESEQFTGVGICLGASGCDMVFAHRGTVVSTLRIPRGGRSIDELLARSSRRVCIDSFGQSVLNLEWARRIRERPAASPVSEADRQLVERGLNDLVTEVVLGVERLMSPRGKRLSDSLTIVLGGGIAHSAGFELRFRKQLTWNVASLRDANIRLASGGDSSIARGCLVQALLESQNRNARMRISA